MKRKIVLLTTIGASLGALALGGCSQPTDDETSSSSENAVGIQSSDDFERHVTCIHHRRERTTAGGKPLHRAFHLKNQGCLKGDMYVDPKLPEDLKVGIFSKDMRTAKKDAAFDHQVWMRLTNINKPADFDADLRGLALKVLDVKGAAHIDGDPLVGQDFLMNDTRVHFLNHPEEVVRAAEISEKAKPHLGDVPIIFALLTRAKKQLSTPNTLLSNQYHSRAPFKLGEKNVIRYFVETCEPMTGAEVPRLPMKTEDRQFGDPQGKLAKTHDHLGQDLAKRASAPGGICLLFRAYVRSVNDSRSIDDYISKWDVDATTRLATLATIVFPKQDVHAETNEAMCESLQFSPLNTIPAHAGVGVMNEGRKWIYEASRTAASKRARIKDYKCEEIFPDFDTKGTAPPSSTPAPVKPVPDDPADYTADDAEGLASD